jgi:hypothetical protein
MKTRRRLAAPASARGYRSHLLRLQPGHRPRRHRLYAETKVGEDSLGFEYKLLAQKDVGNWIFLYNLVLETEVEASSGR